MATLSGRHEAFDFGARPHSNAVAARYFDRLVRATVGVANLSPAERRDYEAARAGYFRVCVALGRRAAASTVTPENIATAKMFHGSRSGRRARSRRRRKPSRSAIGRDDGEPSHHAVFPGTAHRALLITCELLAACPECAAPVERVAGWVSLSHMADCSIATAVRGAP